MILSSLGLYAQARKDLLLGSFPKCLILVGVGLGLYIRNSFSKLSMWDLWFVPNIVFMDRIPLEEIVIQTSLSEKSKTRTNQ